MFFRSEDHEVSGSAFLDPSCWKVVQIRRIYCHLFKKLHQRQVTGADEGSDPECERSLKPDDAAWSRGDGAFFLFSAVRSVICRDEIDRAIREPSDNRKPVFFFPERRIHFGERAVFEHCFIRQGEMMGRRLSVEIRAQGFEYAHQFHGTSGTDMLDHCVCSGAQGEKAVSRYEGFLCD